MSKADQLGAGRFGGGSSQGVSARRRAVAAATGVPTEGVAAPTELPVRRVSLNPDNPRSTLGDLTDLAGSLKDHGQKQAITVMNRDAYIKANPDREEDLEAQTTHVVIDGSSRLAAAREAGLDVIKVMVSDDQGGTAEELLESALVANIHRQDLEELDEARALERLLAIHGSQTALAKRLHRSQGWVSQRLALLNLTPELRERIGEEPIDLLRAVGNKPPEQQETALEELKRQRARKAAEKEEQQRRRQEEPRTPEAPSESSATTNGYDDVREEARRTEEGPRPVATAVGETRVEPPAGEAPVRPAADAVARTPVGERQRNPAEGVPEPRANPSVSTPPTPPKLPYDDGTFLAQHLIRKMNGVEFNKMLRILNDHQQKKGQSAG